MLLGIESHLDVALVALGVCCQPGKGQSVFVCNISCTTLGCIAKLVVLAKNHW